MKDKILSLVFLSILFGFGVATIFVRDREISLYERRKLMGVKELKEDIIANLDEYLSDQFPLRDEFISLNTAYERYGLLNREKNGVYIEDGIIYEKNYPESTNGIQDFIKKMRFIENEFLRDNRTFYTIIPDKNHYLKGAYLKTNYDNLNATLEEGVRSVNIAIEDMLDVEDYYKTDIHLRQKAYFEYVKALSSHMGFTYRDLEYSKVVYEPFYGASYAKGPKFIRPDVLEYYVDKDDDITVKHLEFGLKEMYDKEKLKGVDSYDVFLSGPSALVEIENEDAELGELIVFRDSFGSSLAPLLSPYYKKITLVDLRYIEMTQVTKYVDLTNADVLFLYGAQSVQSSHLLKVKVS